MFTAQLELSEPEIIYRPSLDIKIHNNFYDMVWTFSCKSNHVFFSDIIKTIAEIQVTSILEDIFNMASLVPRIAQVPTVAQGHHVGHQHQYQRCACSSAACYSRKSSGYSSYHTIPGNSKKVYVLVYFQNITCKCQLISNNFQIINFRMESGRRKTRIWGYRN